jgi:hypothetical protein
MCLLFEGGDTHEDTIARFSRESQSPEQKGKTSLVCNMSRPVSYRLQRQI